MVGVMKDEKKVAVGGGRAGRGSCFRPQKGKDDDQQGGEKLEKTGEDRKDGIRRNGGRPLKRVGGEEWERWKERLWGKRKGRGIGD